MNNEITTTLIMRSNNGILVYIDLEYKCDWYGKQLIVVDPKDTSRICSSCGQKNHEFDDLTQNEWLSTREWTCPTCHQHHDRDVNAAINILNKGLTA